MFDPVDIAKQLELGKHKNKHAEEQLVDEANRILRSDLFKDEKVLQNLKQYNQLFEVLNEEDLDSSIVFTSNEIKEVAVKHRLKFLESKFYQAEIPYEAILKIKAFNKQFGKDLKVFRVLALPAAFKGKNLKTQRSLFVKTNYDNYFLLHRWGESVKWYRQYKYLPLRTFDSLAYTILLFTLCLTLVLPTELITLDSKATYWSGYRAATYFHLLFFNFGVTAYFTFAFTLNFSSSIWNRMRDFE